LYLEAVQSIVLSMGGLGWVAIDMGIYLARFFKNSLVYIRSWGESIKKVQIGSIAISIKTGRIVT
jgi:hypothetical protein